MINDEAFELRTRDKSGLQLKTSQYIYMHIQHIYIEREREIMMTG